MKTLNDTPQLRAKRIKAYDAEKYTFAVPPVYAGNWDTEAWCNWVKFNDDTLTGFLPYNKQKHREALNR